ncbi:MAG TPA: ATP-binding cassette domain-containing protein [Kofleriaceae bacterium]|nr:ATP-binding cassette domain-containing protein [Kofleriaceae bacterium]
MSKSYGSVQALKQVSFSVEKGEVIGLLGPNGAGKTTLMKILTGYLQPDEGSAALRGIDVVADPLSVQRRIGYLPENAPVYSEMTVQEYLLMMAELRDIPVERRRSMLSDAIYAAGLEGYLTRSIGALSKGYRQRVGIAQTILHRPEVLILDEPTSGLDPTQIAEIRALIKRLAETATVMLSTHILTEVEMTCERVLVIMRGRLRADARLDDLRAGHAAVVAIEKGAAGVRDALRGVAGVVSAELDHRDAAPMPDGFERWRVTGGEDDLCPALFEALRHRSWKVAELRSDTRTLEAVFRELEQRPDIETDDAAPSGGAAAEDADAEAGAEAGAGAKDKKKEKKAKEKAKTKEVVS